MYLSIEWAQDTSPETSWLCWPPLQHLPLSGHLAAGHGPDMWVLILERQGMGMVATWDLSPASKRTFSLSLQDLLLVLGWKSSCSLTSPLPPDSVQKREWGTRWSHTNPI